MKLDEAFKTRTMARILASQGQIKKAKDIYSHLLRQNPGQKELEEELAALDNPSLDCMQQPQTSADTDLLLLYRSFIKTSFSFYRKTNN